MRAGAITPMRLVQGSDSINLVEWYKAAPGAKVFPTSHAFGSAYWDGDWVNYDQGPGVIGPDAQWAPGRNPGYPGKCIPPHLEWFKTGVPLDHADDPPPELLCCKVYRVGVCNLVLEASADYSGSIRETEADFVFDIATYTVPGLYAANANLALSAEDLYPSAYQALAELVFGAENDYVEPGTIAPFAGPTPPTGWLGCDGAAISRTTYAALFAAIGSTWGAGDGSTTFNVPDFRGRALIGEGTGPGLSPRSLADVGGDESVTLTLAQLPSKSDTFVAAAIGGSFNVAQTLPSIGINDNTYTISNGGSDSPHPNMQPFAVVNWIIKG